MDIKDGATGTFVLRHGEYVPENAYNSGGQAGEPVKIEVRGTARRFEQVERVYDEEGIAIGKTTEFHWEIVTGDPVYPAVGFLPENVLTFTEN